MGICSFKLTVADEGVAAAGPLVADRAILAAFSSCVRDLPLEGEEWDISQLLIEGQPVQRQTVVFWLNIAYRQTLDEPFEQQDAVLPRSMTGLSQLLAFVDAVGSVKALLRVCLSQLDDVCAFVSIPPPEGQAADAAQWEVGVNTSCYWEDDTYGEFPTELYDGKGHRTICMLKPDLFGQQAFIAQQVAQQTEQLLFFAHKLQLPALQQKLHAFLRSNTVDPDYLLYGYLGSVLSDRVLEVAVDKQQLRQMAINSIVTEHCSFIEHAHAANVLKPLKLNAQQRVPINFKAELDRDAFGYSKGSTVDVSLNLFSEHSCITINNDAKYAAQLVVGSLVCDKQSMDALMGPPPAAVEPQP